MHSSPVVTVAGAKGGVGKTTTSINLGVALADRGLDVVVLELDLAMANVVDFLSLPGADDAPTVHDVLAGEAAVTDALALAPGGVTVAPSSTDLDALDDVDVSRVPEVVEELADLFDAVLIDTAAGVNSATTTAIDLADYAVLVSTPRVASLRDADKTQTLADRSDGDVAGLVLTMTGTGTAPPSGDLADFLDVDLLASVPDDPSVPGSQDAGVPVVERKPDGPVASAYRQAAERIHRQLAAREPSDEDGTTDDGATGDPDQSDEVPADSGSVDTTQSAGPADDARDRTGGGARTDRNGGERPVPGTPPAPARNAPGDTPTETEASIDMTTDDTTDDAASDEPDAERETPSKEDLEAQGWTFPGASDDESGTEPAGEESPDSEPEPDSAGEVEVRQATDGGVAGGYVEQTILSPDVDGESAVPSLDPEATDDDDDDESLSGRISSLFGL
ncbi:P-loop NTPase [Halomicrobium urmianum]|uniref:P-loop NTPase n=1 Tax=Halomicrobium urmianum TaxID=1586233 RepID=UPI001CD97E4A|nr:P-loop NTPase [Halomicrobium urmianum]